MESLPGIVYIVDDDASVRRSSERLVQSMGFEARGFATGDRAPPPHKVELLFVQNALSDDV